MRGRRDIRHSRGLSGVFDRQNLRTPTQNVTGQLGVSPDVHASGSASHNQTTTRPLRAQASFTQMLPGFDTGRALPQKRSAQYDIDELEAKADELHRFLLQNKFESETHYVLPRVAAEAPSQPAIEGIFLFLKQFIDPYSNPNGNFKTDFPKVLRHLDYPAATSIRRHTLVNAGLNHVWPTVLDGLYYMMRVAIKMNEVALGAGAVSEKMGLDALQERQIVKAYNSRINATEANTQDFHQEEVDTALLGYCQKTAASVRVLADQNRALDAELADLESQKTSIEALASNETQLATRKSDLEKRHAELGAELSLVRQKQNTLQAREKELVSLHEDIEGKKQKFKLFFSENKKLHAIYSPEKLEEFLENYRDTYRLHKEAVLEYTTLESRRLNIFSMLRRTFDKIFESVEEYNDLAPKNFDIDIGRILSADLGKTARILWGRSISEIEKELVQTAVSSSDRVEQLQSDTTAKARRESELAPHLRDLQEEVIGLRQELDETEASNRKAEAILEQDSASFTTWVARVEAGNAETLASKQHEEETARALVEATQAKLAQWQANSELLLSPIVERLAAAYDEFSVAYNRFGGSINGMLGASLQIVKSMETDGSLSKFESPQDFETQNDIANSMFDDYCNALASRTSLAM